MPVPLLVPLIAGGAGLLVGGYFAGDDSEQNVTAETFIQSQTAISAPAVLAVSVVALAAGYFFFAKGRG